MTSVAPTAQTLDVMPLSLVEIQRRFGRTCLHRQFYLDVLQTTGRISPGLQHSPQSPPWQLHTISGSIPQAVVRIYRWTFRSLHNVCGSHK